MGIGPDCSLDVVESHVTGYHTVNYHDGLGNLYYGVNNSPSRQEMAGHPTVVVYNDGSTAPLFFGYLPLSLGKETSALGLRTKFDAGAAYSICRPRNGGSDVITGAMYFSFGDLNTLSELNLSPPPPSVSLGIQTTIIGQLTNDTFVTDDNRLMKVFARLITEGNIYFFIPLPMGVNTNLNYVSSINTVIDWGDYINVPVGLPGAPKIMHFRTTKEYNDAKAAGQPVGEYSVYPINVSFTDIALPHKSFGDLYDGGYSSLGYGYSAFRLPSTNTGVNPYIKSISATERVVSGISIDNQLQYTNVQHKYKTSVFGDPVAFIPPTTQYTPVQPVTAKSALAHRWGCSMVPEDHSDGVRKGLVFLDQNYTMRSINPKGAERVIMSSVDVEVGTAMLSTSGKVLTVNFISNGVHYRLTDFNNDKPSAPPNLVNGVYLDPVDINLGGSVDTDTKQVSFW